ncbi:nuclear transport factor 2 family protein [Sphingobium sp. JS3065]|uniref:nuclear transport factor 2 family protein n=1 Tax=Sphingobium sp. JS3065 TaxID=2970925 RepID=UPI002264FBBC|nr:nuclear transport factor 2 family protein [Sphingobium sp. JS3065]UZW57366.1 nuclear transport factor 2 family protein [Sphingobium sp. JS3065]
MHVLTAFKASFILAGLAAFSPAFSAAARPTNSTNACDVARTYIRLTAEGRYDEVGDLWAPDAVFFNPRGDIIRGQPAIKQFYSTFLKKITPENRIGSLTWDAKANICVMELETRVVRDAAGKWTPDARGNFVRTAIDRFVVNKQGKVQEMRVYLAPDKAWLEK